MRAILISIKPKYVAKILNGEKTIEIRKTCPEIFKHLKPYEGCSIDVYIYCTKEQEMLYSTGNKKWFVIRNRKDVKRLSNGMVKAKFTLKRVEEIEPFEEYDSPVGLAYKLTKKKIITCQKAQLTYDEYNHYLKGKNGYAWYISNLVIFDKPKELSEFKSYKKNIVNTKINGMVFETELDNSLIKAPQSWQFIETEELE